MAKIDRPSLRLAGHEQDSLHADWSRSGKRLIVTVGKRDARAQVELEPAQVEELRRFLADTLDT